MIKDKNGFYVNPQLFQGKNQGLSCEIFSLEEKLCSLRVKYEESVSAYASAIANNNILRNMIKDRDTIIDDLIATDKAEKAVLDVPDMKEDILMCNEFCMDMKNNEFLRNKHGDIENKLSEYSSNSFQARIVSRQSAEPNPSLWCLEEPRSSYHDEYPTLLKVSRMSVIEKASHNVTPSYSYYGKSSSPTCEQFTRHSEN